VGDGSSGYWFLKGLMMVNLTAYAPRREIWNHCPTIQAKVEDESTDHWLLKYLYAGVF